MAGSPTRFPSVGFGPQHQPGGEALERVRCGPLFSGRIGLGDQTLGITRFDPIEQRADLGKRGWGVPCCHPVPPSPNVWARSPSDGTAPGWAGSAVPSLLNDREGRDGHCQPPCPHSVGTLEGEQFTQRPERCWCGACWGWGERALGSAF